MQRLVENGLLDRFQKNAKQRFTFVHSTTRKSADEIMAAGFQFSAGEEDPLRMETAFVEVVPEDYPDAQNINMTVLGFRRGNFPAKVVVQFPIAFPEAAYTDTAKMHWGHTPLKYADEALDAGLVKLVDGKVVLPSEYVAGWIDMDTGEFHARPEPNLNMDKQ